MKKTKIIIPALALLLLGTAASVTGTVAWFSMNADVTATGMTVKAVAEQGIVISNKSNGTYGPIAESVKDTTAELLPASTADLAHWWHAKSNDPANHAAVAGTYTSANTEGTYYISHDFYIRSSAAEELEINSLDVKSISVEDTRVAPEDEEDEGLQNLSKALRVGIQFEDSTNYFIYAPFTGATTSYSVYNNGNDLIPVTAKSATTVSNDALITSLPSNTEAGQHAVVYIWFEGEDENCISNNIKAVLEELTVSVEFSYTEKTNG